MADRFRCTLHLENGGANVVPPLLRLACLGEQAAGSLNDEDSATDSIASSPSSDPGVRTMSAAPTGRVVVSS